MSDSTSYDLPSEIWSVVAEHLLSDLAFGSCANLNVVSRLVHCGTLPALFHTVDWTLKLRGFGKRSTAGLDCGPSQGEVWEERRELDALAHRQANEWLADCPDSPGIKHLQFLTIPRYSKTTPFRYPDVTFDKPTLKAVTAIELFNCVQKLGVDIMLCSGFQFGSSDCDHVTTLGPQGHHSHSYGGPVNGCSRICPILALDVYVDMRYFPQQSGSMETIFHDVIRIIRRLDWKGEPQPYGRSAFESTVWFEGLTPAQRLALQDLAQKEDTSHTRIETNGFPV